MKLQRLYSYTRQAIQDYNMIDNNDKIAIGISGGKDSLTLLYALSGLSKFYPKPFDLVAIMVRLESELQDNNSLYNINKLCDSLSVPFYIVDTEINKIVFDIRQESNPCSLCSKLRKGAFNNKALELGCNKIAYAHHKDDVIETMFLSLLYEGRLHTFEPVTHLDKTNLALIRPLIYISENEIIGFKNKMNLPVHKNPCPADGNTKREYVKNLIRQLNNDNPGIREKIFKAITTGSDFKFS